MMIGNRPLDIPHKSHKNSGTKTFDLTNNIVAEEKNIFS